MNKTISVFDAMLADEFKGWNMFNMIDLTNLDIVTEVLARLGFDTNKAIYVFPANHRTLANEVKVGYMFAGTIAQGREHVRGAYSTEHDRFASAELRDNGLYEELMAMSTRGQSYGIENALDDKIPEREDPEQRAEEKRITQELDLLWSLLYIARGDQRKLDGSIKTYFDYKNPEVPPKPRRKKKRKEQLEGSE